MIGSGGVLPTHWSLGGSATPITREVVGTGTENGIPYVDLRVSSPGITSGSALDLIADHPGPLAVAPGDTVTGSAFIRLLSGAIPGGVMRHVFLGYNAAVVNISTAVAGAFAPGNLPLNQSRFQGTGSLTHADTAFTRYTNRVSVVIGDVFDYTIRIGAPQFEKGIATATSVILPVAGSPAVASRLGESCRVDMTKVGFANGGSSIVVAATPVDSQGGVWRLDDSSNDNYLYPYVTGGTLRTRARTNVGEEINRLVGTVPYGQEFVLRSTFSSGTFRHSLNGGAVAAHGMDMLPLNLNRLYIGCGWAGGGLSFWGTIRRFDIIPRVATDAELPTLSA